MARLTSIFTTIPTLRRAVAAAIVLAAAVPGYAQTVGGSSKAVEATLNGWIEAFNRGDSTGQFFTNDATLVRGNGVFVGGLKIDEMEQRESKAGLRLALKIDRVEPLGTESMWTLGQYTLTVPCKDGAPPQSIPGVAVHLLQRDGSTWRVKVSSFTRVQTPPPPQAALK